jgi:hypothetical protein
MLKKIMNYNFGCQVYRFGLEFPGLDLQFQAEAFQRQRS